MSCEVVNGNISMPDGSPVNYDGLKSTDFRLSFPKMPYLMMFLQEVRTPDVSVREVIQATRYADINNAGEKMVYGDVTFTVMVDKNLKVYKQVFEWMRRMTVGGSSIGEYDNPILLINNTETIRFVEAWPLEMSGLNFKVDVNDVQYLTVDITFNVDYIEFVDEPFFKVV